MYQIVQDFNHDIFAETDGPFVSIYQNTHQSSSDIHQDQITFKNHLKEAEKVLKSSYDDVIVNDILDPLKKLRDDKPFWEHNLRSVAILASKNDFVVFRLNGEVKEKAIVANSFHVKPLIRHFQTRGTYDVLALNKENFKLYTCTLDQCIEVSFEEDVPVTKEAVLGTFDQEEYLSHASYNGASNHAMYHGHNDNKDVLEKDVERYFRYIDTFIKDTYSKPTNRKVLLWALPEHQGIFRKISSNQFLMEEGVHKSDHSVDEAQILEKTKEIILPIYNKEINHVKDRYFEAKAKNLASDDLKVIGKKIKDANIDTAIISSDTTLPGKYNQETGEITKGKINNPLNDDVLDDLAEAVYQQGGSVIVLEKEKMPTENGIAVIFRY